MFRAMEFSLRPETSERHSERNSPWDRSEFRLAENISPTSIDVSRGEAFLLGFRLGGGAFTRWTDSSTF